MSRMTHVALAGVCALFALAAVTTPSSADTAKPATAATANSAMKCAPKPAAKAAKPAAKSTAKPGAKKTMVAKLVDINTCPMTGEKAMDASGGTEVVGKYRVHFCCGGCQPQFDKKTKAQKLTQLAQMEKAQNKGK